MSDDAIALQQMLANLASSSSKDADLLLMQLEPETARLLELCAIPHVFDEHLVHILDPSAPPELIEELMAELPALPAVRQVADCFALHDLVREQMFQRWLSSERRAKLSVVSHRLVEHFSRASSPDAVQVEANRSIVVFHQIGVDVVSGFTAFRTLYRDYRSSSRYSACESLVRLVGEYRSVLSAVELAWLTYYEAETAADSRNPGHAASLLMELKEQVLPAELLILVLVRLAAALRGTNQLGVAEIRAQRALALGSAAPEGQALLHLVYQELGLIARQRGDIETAERNLTKAIELARDAGDRLAVARAYNSLGTMFQKLAPRRAIEMYEACTAWLDQKTDLTRMASVLNNLGMAYANVGDWAKSGASYERSLEIKRAAADFYGQALTQLNIARVYQAQQKGTAARHALTESAVLFESMHDLAAAARARRELARVLRRAGANDEAVSEFHSAVELFEKANQSDAARELESEFATRSPWRARIAWAVVSLTVIGGLALVLVFS